MLNSFSERPVFAMIHLQSIQAKTKARQNDTFPFTLPLIQNFRSITFTKPVTFFVGENGSGKSTLLEAIAAGSRLPAVGGAEVADDETLGPARALASTWEFGWQHKIRQGFFLRAEDFFNFARRTNQLRADMAALAEEHARAAEDRPFADGLRLAQGAALGQKAALEARYGGALDARSHGESFLTLFQSRLVPGGLYLLDEPEAALSPLRQLALLSLLKQMVEAQCQFIIATHSPLLLAFPEAALLHFEAGAFAPAVYDDLEHVMLLRAFLADPQSFLHRL
jgi:predicted ATPase